MKRCAALLILALGVAACGSISKVQPDGAADRPATDGAKGDAGDGAVTTDASATDTGTTTDASDDDAGGSTDGSRPDGGGVLMYRGGISTFGPAPAPAATGLRLIGAGLRVPAAPVCNTSLCFTGGITQ